MLQLTNNKQRMAALVALLLALWGCGGSGSGSLQKSQGRSVSLAWQAPQTMADGTALNSLGGYRVHYSQETASSFTHMLDVESSTTATISDLSPGTWCFAVTAYNKSGVESDYSTPVCTEV